MLDGNNMLADDNVYYRDIDLDRADFALDPAGSFQLRGPLRRAFANWTTNAGRPRRSIH